MDYLLRFAVDEPKQNGTPHKFNAPKGVVFGALKKITNISPTAKIQCLGSHQVQKQLCYEQIDV